MPLENQGKLPAELMRHITKIWRQKKTLKKAKNSLAKVRQVTKDILFRSKKLICKRNGEKLPLIYQVCVERGLILLSGPSSMRNLLLGRKKIHYLRT